MSRRSKTSFDWILLTVFISIVFIGWLMLYAVSYEGPGFWFDFDSIVGRQTIWLGISAVAVIVFLTLDWRIFNSLSFPIYIFTTLLLIAVLFLGKEIKGASSWFILGGFSFQPSELAKLGTALGLSAYLGQANISMEKTKDVLVSFAIFLVPASLILLQPDAGSALIFMSFIIPLFRAGLNASLYLLGIALAFILIGSLMWTPYVMLLIIMLTTYLILSYNNKEKRIPVSLVALLALVTISSYRFLDYKFLLIMMLVAGIYFFYLIYKQAKYQLMIFAAATTVFSIVLSFLTQWGFDNLLKPHQQDRINVWLRPELTDPRGALYNIIQSKTAIGSGGFTGKGFLEGNMTKLNYVPEQSTDFVFSILGEEQGFLGSASLIVLFTILLFRISLIAEKSKLLFIRYYAYSVAGLLFFHFFINIGMTVGIMPVIGIPLPFMSKGGSSLLSFSIMIAILLKMDEPRNRS